MVALSIEQLEARTGFAARQIRYLIAEGLMPAPTGGRAHARYGEEHLAAIERYKKLKNLGFSPASIRLLLQEGQGVSLDVGPGVKLVIDPNLIGSGQDPEPTVERVVVVLRNALLGDHSDGIP